MSNSKWWAGFIPAVMVATSVACAGGGDVPDAGSMDTAEVQPAFQVTDGQVPQFEPDPLHFELLPNLWVAGQASGLAIDSDDNVWVFHRPRGVPLGEQGAALDPPTSDCCIPAPSVLQYDANGQFVQAWGGPGEGYEWFANEHAIWVDSQDNVWLGGNGEGDNHILKFSSSGEFLMQIGRAGMNTGSNDTENVGGPADLFVLCANERGVRGRWVRQQENHRLRRRHRRLQAPLGGLRQSARRRPRAAKPGGVRGGNSRQAKAAPQQFNNPVHAVSTSPTTASSTWRTVATLRIQVFNLDGAFVQETVHQAGHAQQRWLGPWARHITRSRSDVPLCRGWRQRLGTHPRQSRHSTSSRASAGARATTPVSSSTCTASSPTQWAICLSAK